MHELAFMVGLVGGLGLVLWAMRRDAPRHERVPVMSAAEDWEKEGEGWKSQPEPEDTGAPGYYLPPARDTGLLRVRSVGCPKCRVMNALRALEQLPPIRFNITYRKSDSSLWCHAHSEHFKPLPNGGLAAITVDKAA